MPPVVIVFIGGSSGLGFNALTKLLLSDTTQYKIILGSRAPLPTSQQRKLDPLLKSSSSTLERLEIELTSFKSIQSFCEKLKQAYPEPIDQLVLCAGMIPGYFQTTEDGNERSLQVNTLSQALIVQLLSPKLAPGGRILFVGTSLHRKVLPRTLTPDTIDATLNKQPFGPMEVYFSTKFIQMFVFNLTQQKFAQDPRGIRVLIVSPGFVPETGLVREMSLIKRMLMQNVAPRMMFVTTPDQAGLNIRRGMIDDIPNGTYFSKRKVENMAEEIYDPELQWRWKEFLVARGVWDPNDLNQATQVNQPTQPTQVPQVAQVAQAAQAAQVAEPTQAAPAAQPTQPTQATRAVQDAEPTQPTQAAQATQVAQPQPAQVAQTAQPTPTAQPQAVQPAQPTQAAPSA